MTSRNRRRTAARDVKLRVAASHPDGPEECIVLGCRRFTARSIGKGLSSELCRAHSSRLRRHGHSTRPSYAAAELAPYRQAARAWLALHGHAPRVRAAVQSLDSLTASVGRSLTADHHAAAVPREKARSVLARLYEAGKGGAVLLEAVLTILAIHRETGPWGAPSWVPIQIAKLVKRLKGVSGTHWRKEGINLPSRFPRSEGTFMVLLGNALRERAEIAIDDTTIPHILAAAHAGKNPCTTPPKRR